MASLRNIGGDRWQVSVYAGRDASGRQKRVTRVFNAPNLQTARRMAGGIEGELRKTLPDPESVGRTMGWLVDEWLAHRKSLPNTSPGTLEGYGYIAERIKADLGKVRLTNMSAKVIDDWYAQLRQRTVAKRPITESRVHHYHRVLGAIIRQGNRWGYIDRGVIERVTPPTPRKRPVALPDDADVAKVLDKAPGDIAMLLRLYASTGARRSEVLGLTWGDLDGDRLVFQRTVVQAQGQPLTVKNWLKNPNEPPRIVLLDRDTVARLAEYRQRLVDGLHDVGSRMGAGVFLFPDLVVDPTGRTPRKPDTVTRIFGRICKEQGISMRLHDLRHWHASQLIAAGAPITDVAARLGHSQTSTTLNIYAHATRANDGMLADIIGAALKNAESPQRRAGGDGRVG